MRKLRRVLLVTSLLFAVAIGWQTPHASANTGDYPYADKPCIWAPFAVHGTAANWCPDYDWGDIAGNESSASVISPYGYYYRNCTDYTAWKVSFNGIGPELYKGLGNAKDWAARTAAKGVRVDGTPAAGAVAVRTTGTYGHTAYVEAVHADGSVTISHYNYAGTGVYSVQQGMPAAFGLTLFIHFEDVNQPVSPEVAPDPQPAVTTIEAPPVLPDPEATRPEPTPEAQLTAATETLTEELPVPVDPAVEEPPAPVILATAEAPVSAAEAVQSLVSVPQQPQVAQITQSVPPARTTWTQAAKSPPSVTITASEPLSKREPLPEQPTYNTSYWPLLGLAGVLLVQTALTRKFRITTSLG